MGKIIKQKDIPLYRRFYKSQTVVAACGCFDIFHIGHYEYLSGAKKLGDVIFVGVNSNQSYRNLKEKAPTFDVEQRMQILAALICIDFVFCFDEISFGTSLKLIKPAIFVRGVDAQQKGFPEKATAETMHIDVRIVGDYKKSSSSELKKQFE